MLEINISAPDFTLEDQDNNSFTLSENKGKMIVLYFYPKDDTPGCTLEAKDFTAAIDEFKALNVIVIGISKDNPSCHAKFIDKYTLRLPLLSDIDTTVCKQYGVWQEKSMMGKKYMGIERTTFLIDDQGTIRHIWPKVKTAGHAAEVLHFIKQSNT